MSHKNENDKSPSHESEPLPSQIRTQVSIASQLCSGGPDESGWSSTPDQSNLMSQSESLGVTSHSALVGCLNPVLCFLPKGSPYLIAILRSIYVQMASSVSRVRETSPTPNTSRPTKQVRPNQLQHNLNAFFNSEAHDKRERDQIISQLYALQLQDARTTIN